ncbi:hypothetical protein RBB50_000723 [Rhinocladiella similis]
MQNHVPIHQSPRRRAPYKPNQVQRDVQGRLSKDAKDAKDTDLADPNLRRYLYDQTYDASIFELPSSE